MATPKEAITPKVTSTRKEAITPKAASTREKSKEKGGGGGGGGGGAPLSPYDTSTKEKKQQKHEKEGQGHTSRLPRTLLIDMDGTLIGRISPQLCEYDILTRVQKNKIKQFRTDLVSKMRQGIVRPYLAEFCHRVKKDSPHTELFVYTASDDKWAKFLVPVIEEAIGFKFQRPLFTRKHCVLPSSSSSSDYKKSIDLVAPLIYKSLRTKYPLMRGPNDVMRNVALIDNNHSVMLKPADPKKDGRGNMVTSITSITSMPSIQSMPLMPSMASNVSIAENADRLIRCPTYSYEYHCDVLAKVDTDVLQEKYADIIPVLVDFDLFVQSHPSMTLSSATVPSFEAFLAQYFTSLAANARSSLKNSQEHLRDRMWVVMADLLTSSSSSQAKPSTSTSSSMYLMQMTEQRREREGGEFQFNPYTASRLSHLIRDRGGGGGRPP